jgi:hypothetical protein
MRTFLLALCFATGCDIEPCDPGQTKVWGASCFPDMPPPPPGGGGAPNGEAGGANVAGEGGADCSPSSQFGDACADSSECLCATDYCAIQPGADTGSCTRSGCVEDPSVCPSDFECVDLSALDPSLPSICVPPS